MPEVYEVPDDASGSEDADVVVVSESSAAPVIYLSDSELQDTSESTGASRVDAIDVESFVPSRSPPASQDTEYFSAPHMAVPDFIAMHNHQQIHEMEHMRHHNQFHRRPRNAIDLHTPAGAISFYLEQTAAQQEANAGRSFQRHPRTVPRETDLPHPAYEPLHETRQTSHRRWRFGGGMGRLTRRQMAAQHAESFGLQNFFDLYLPRHIFETVQDPLVYASGASADPRMTEEAFKRTKEELEARQTHRDGYEEDLSADKSVVCVLCGAELGIGIPDTAEFNEEKMSTEEAAELKDSRDGKSSDLNIKARRPFLPLEVQQSRHVYFAKCGHVYCGLCYQNIGRSGCTRPRKRKKTNGGEADNKDTSGRAFDDCCVPQCSKYGQKDHWCFPIKCAVPGCSQIFKQKNVKPAKVFTELYF